MYYDKKTTIYLDGQWLKAEDGKTGLYSQSLHYGVGVFEGIRSYKTDEGAAIFKAKEHYERLLFSADKMNIEIKNSVNDLTEVSYNLLKRNGLENAYIRPLVYVGADMSLQTSKEVHVMICAWAWDKYLGDSLSLVTSPFQRPNPKSCFVEAKVTGHYTNSILATSDAKSQGYDEALLLDMHGFVAEGPGANFFYEKEGKLYTPPRGNILPGITRSTVFELAEELGYQVVEKSFTVSEVYDADGAFFCGTAAEIAAIKSLDNQDFKLSWEDTIGSEISFAYNNRVRNRSAKNYELV